MLAREDRVDDECLEPGVPEPARLGCAGVHVCSCERDVTGVPQDRLGHAGVLPGNAVVEDIHDGSDDLQGLLQADRSHQLAGSRGEHVGRDPRLRRRVFVPLDERRDALLGNALDCGLSRRRHLAIPGQRAVQLFQHRCGEFRSGASEPAELLCLLVHDRAMRLRRRCPIARRSGRGGCTCRLPPAPCRGGSCPAVPAPRVRGRPWSASRC